MKLQLKKKKNHMMFFLWKTPNSQMIPVPWGCPEESPGWRGYPSFHWGSPWPRCGCLAYGSKAEDRSGFLSSNWAIWSKAWRIKSLEEIFLPAHEEIWGYWLFPGASLKDEVLEIMPVQKQSWAAQWTRFKGFVVIGNNNGHIGTKGSKEVAIAIWEAIILA